MMRHGMTLCTLAALTFLLTAVPGAQAESICDSLPTDVFHGVATVTAFRHEPDQSVDFSPAYAVNSQLTRPDAGLLSPPPTDHGDATGNSDARQMLYVVDCAADQDTVFTVANLESQNNVTVHIEYFLNGRSIFTQGNTIRPGRIVNLSAANGLAQSY